MYVLRGILRPILLRSVHSTKSETNFLPIPRVWSYFTVIGRMSSHGSAIPKPKIFDEHKNMFECIVLDLRKPCHQCTADEFDGLIKASLDVWKARGVRAVTVHVQSELSDRIPTLIKHGFDFHHAKEGYVLMLKWLSETDDNNFPPYANHYLGVAGLVVNQHNQVLTIKERFSGTNARWKLPGGGADLGEDLAQTARREVLEETGVDSEFIGVLCMRHLHGFRYGCSDFYYVCLMKALSTDIKKCDQEVSECIWMDLEEYGRQELFPANQYIYECLVKARETGILLVPEAVTRYTGTGTHLMYSPKVVDVKAILNSSGNAKL